MQYYLREEGFISWKPQVILGVATISQQAHLHDTALALESFNFTRKY